MPTHAPHAHCFACGPQNGAGLGLTFHLEPDTSVWCRHTPAAAFDSYPQVLHSGIVATLLDAAMAHCLFAQGHTAYASDLTVRFLAPVVSGQELLLKARFLRGRFPVCVLEAQILQAGQCRASATGTYTKQPRVALKLGRRAATPEETP